MIAAVRTGEKINKNVTSCWKKNCYLIALTRLICVLCNRQKSIVDIIMTARLQWTFNIAVNTLNWLAINPQLRSTLGHSQHYFVPAIVKQLSERIINHNSTCVQHNNCDFLNWVWKKEPATLKETQKLNKTFSMRVWVACYCWGSE